MLDLFSVQWALRNKRSTIETVSSIRHCVCPSVCHARELSKQRTVRRIYLATHLIGLDQGSGSVVKKTAVW